MKLNLAKKNNILQVTSTDKYTVLPMLNSKCLNSESVVYFGTTLKTIGGHKYDQG